MSLNISFVLPSRTRLGVSEIKWKTISQPGTFVCFVHTTSPTCPGIPNHHKRRICCFKCSNSPQEGTLSWRGYFHAGHQTKPVACLSAVARLMLNLKLVDLIKVFRVHDSPNDAPCAPSYFNFSSVTEISALISPACTFMRAGSVFFLLHENDRQRITNIFYVRQLISLVLAQPIQAS